MIEKITPYLAEAKGIFSLLLHWFKASNHYIFDRFGLWGQIVLDLFLFYLIFVFLKTLFKITINLLGYVILPSFLLSGITSWLTSFPLINTLPIFLAFFLLVSFLRK
jgi:hypothetical protein